MPRDALRTLLWDLRGQYEASLRTLTAAQRCFDEWRSAATASKRNAALREMRQHLGALEVSNHPLAEVLADAVKLAGTTAEERA
jgi:hypothetical protein